MAKVWLAAVSKMAFGNKLGVSIRSTVWMPRDAFAPGFGNIVAEVAPEDAG
ncbi:MAG: hypothetical protein ACLTDV_13495 [Eubacterium sp.]